MIQRNYQQLKFKRTYLGGSKEKELEIFNHVQNDNSVCDWIEYRRILFPYLDDMLHINFSRSHATKYLSYALMGLSFFSCVLHIPVLSIILVILSTIFYVLYKFFEKKITETLFSYNISVNIIKNEIKIITGLDI